MNGPSVHKDLCHVLKSKVLDESEMMKIVADQSSGRAFYFVSIKFYFVLWAEQSLGILDKMHRYLQETLECSVRNIPRWMMLFLKLLEDTTATRNQRYLHFARLQCWVLQSEVRVSSTNPALIKVDPGQLQTSSHVHILKWYVRLFIRKLEKGMDKRIYLAGSCFSWKNSF